MDRSAIAPKIREEGAEALEELNSLGVEKPTHIFIQAGVSSFRSSSIALSWA